MTRILQTLLCASTALFGEIAFQKESVIAIVTACDTLEVRGYYYFVNTDTVRSSVSIYYPFPVDSTLSYPHRIEVQRMSDRIPLRYLVKREGIVWDMAIPGHAADSIRVVYRQYAPLHSGRYILSTTRYWKKPLEKADTAKSFAKTFSSL